MGDIFCIQDDLIVFEILFIFELVIFVVVELKIKGDMEKFFKVLVVLVEEDFIFCVNIDFEIGQIVIVGMGEFYLEILVDCMLCEFKVEVNIGVFQVFYCEIICGFVGGEGKFFCQIGGKG